MRNPVIRLIVSLGYVLLGAAIISAVAQAQAPTPLVSLPEAPSLDILSGPLSDGVVTWTDNSDNEDGFRISVSVWESEYVTELQFEVGPNVTSFTLPSEARLQCPDRISLSVIVSAFNAAGASPSGSAGTSASCAAFAAPSPTTTAVALPNTGATPDGGGLTPLWLILLGGGLALLAAFAWRLARRGSPY